MYVLETNDIMQLNIRIMFVYSGAVIIIIFQIFTS
jgi:hypothetical protein